MTANALLLFRLEMALNKKIHFVSSQIHVASEVIEKIDVFPNEWVESKGLNKSQGSLKERSVSTPEIAIIHFW